jgi:hypothetical protein
MADDVRSDRAATAEAAIPAASTTPTTIQIAVWCPLELVGGWKLAAAKPTAARKSRPLAT